MKVPNNNKILIPAEKNLGKTPRKNFSFWYFYQKVSVNFNRWLLINLIESVVNFPDPWSIPHSILWKPGFENFFGYLFCFWNWISKLIILDVLPGFFFYLTEIIGKNIKIGFRSNFFAIFWSKCFKEMKIVYPVFVIQIQQIFFIIRR